MTQEAQQVVTPLAALKLALDALERLRPEGFFNEAITAIKEALREHAMREVQRLGQEIEQEPVTYWKEHAQGLQRDYDSLLAEFQAQRTWVGLTNDELTDLFYNTNLGQQSAVAQAIALLKQKNT